jgi:hypothetical protein
MNTRRWIIIIVLVFGLGMPATPVSAARSATITITPPLPNPAPVGSEVSFAILITITDVTPGVSGADIYLGYDTPVEPSVSPNSAVVPLPDFFGPSHITWYEILDPCPVPRGERTSPACIHLVAAGPAQETHSAAVARFYFQVKAGGPFCFEVLDATLADKDGFRVDHTIADPNPQCVNPGGTIEGKVLRQGTPANSGGGTLACAEVELIPPAVHPEFTDGSGKFIFKNVPSGTYRVRAKYPGYLASETITTVPPSQDVGSTQLCGGDVNADNKINILDIGTIISKFGQTNMPVRSDPQEGCTDADEPADINDDSMVNIFDLAIAAHNWGPQNNTGPTGWKTNLCDP